ncbi:MAG: alpha/beta hydrolase [Streptosporangiaceae bacterium]
MGLTSRSFVELTIAAAVAGIGVTVWLWPQVAGRGLAPLAARAGLLAVSQVLAVIALLTGINGYFDFYGSWAALLGNGGSARVSVSERVAHAATARPVIVTGVDLGPVPGGKSVLPVTVTGRLAARPPRYYARHHDAPRRRAASGLELSGSVSRAARSLGEVLQVTVNGAHTGIRSPSVYVYLPPQYFQKAYARSRFPVELALTGYPNESWSIVKFLALPATAARLSARGKTKPAVLVMMNVSPDLPRDTECTNVPAGPQVESFFAQDVPLAIERTFRVQTGRSGWAVLGYSTGGYCAAKLAMLDPGQFSAAVALSGYYTALRDNTTGNLYGSSRAYRNENNLIWRLHHLPAPPVPVLVTATRTEGIYSGTRAFLQAVRPPMRGYSLILPQGGHNYHTWGRELPQSLEWLSARLTPAVAGRAGPGGPPLTR